jgi:hypothetical protein
MAAAVSWWCCCRQWWWSWSIASVAQIEWYVWLVLLAWPTLLLFPLAVLARRIYWYWYEKYQAFLQMEFNTVLPAWSPQIANKEQTDQVAKYGGHRASDRPLRASR